MDSIAVVGGGLAGLRYIEAVRRGGYEGSIHFIDPDEQAPYDRPPLSKGFLRDPNAPVPVLRQAPLEDLKVVVHRQRATHLAVESRTVTLEDATTLEATTIVLATGVRPRPLPSLPGSDLAGIMSLRSIHDAQLLRDQLRPGARVVIIGAGFIGMEVAATAKSLGCDVTVIEALATPLERGLGETVGNMVANWHRSEGVQVECETSVVGFHGTQQITAVECGEGITTPADVVLVGIGAIPNTEWLSESGLQLENGVVCDGQLRAAPGIFALGDLARFEHARYGLVRFEHWTNAVESAMYLGAANGTPEGSTTAFAPVPFVWSDQYDRTIQVVGMSGPNTATIMLRSDAADRSFLAVYEDEGRVVGAAAAGAPKEFMKIRRALMVEEPNLENVRVMLTATGSPE